MQSDRDPPPVIYPNVFTKSGQPGDFKWMITQGGQYKNSLFIFNDNVEQSKTAESGGGNAVIRKYNQFNRTRKKPQSAGIPTGHLGIGGFLSLNQCAKIAIDESIDRTKKLCKKYKYDRIYYSVNKDGTFGTSIFVVGDEVKEYIVQCIHNLGTLHM